MTYVFIKQSSPPSYCDLRAPRTLPKLREEVHLGAPVSVLGTNTVFLAVAFLINPGISETFHNWMAIHALGWV